MKPVPPAPKPVELPPPELKEEEETGLDFDPSKIDKVRVKCGNNRCLKEIIGSI